MIAICNKVGGSKIVKSDRNKVHKSVGSVWMSLTQVREKILKNWELEMLKDENMINGHVMQRW
jgi:hypothetical protein